MTSLPIQAQHYIGGEWLGEPSVPRDDPANTTDVVAVSPAGDEADIDAAIDAAETAQIEWANLPAPARGEVLRLAANHIAADRYSIAEDMTREEGKLLGEALGEVQRTIDVLNFFAGEGQRSRGDLLAGSNSDTELRVTRHPVGVAGLITPWNFPMAIPAWKAAPALVAGNTVVLKPAALTPMSANHLARAFAAAGAAPGVFNVVHGDGPSPGHALAADARVGAVSFTGSTEVGWKVHETVSGRRGRVQLEMGGKNATVVRPTADLDDAARAIAQSSFGLTGQACTATSRVICPANMMGDLLDLLVDHARAISPGPGLDPTSSMGPVVSPAQARRVRGAISAAVADGAEVACGGSEDDGTCFVSPTVLTGVNPSSTAAQVEIFGPVVALLRADQLGEAIELADNVRYGLVASIFTRQIDEALEFSRRVQTGVIKVNRPTTGLDLNVPFGGVKDSSSATYREQGTTATDFFTWTKTTYLGW
ncbi:MAG: aldehyde dehydrogenase family protein [Acidimicrobiia bacterium]|nr:aldehyde dehydrogenase family protein [Acidimicrobiia bacterium]